MPTRADAQNFCRQTLDYDVLADYIKAAHAKGHNLTFMSIVIAAFVRTVSQCPELNRFIMNKQIYARNRISVSFVVLKRRSDDSIMESLAKVEFEATDTIFDVGRKIEEAIGQGREDKSSNLTDIFARTLLAVPGLATVVVGLVKLLDRYGLIPGIVYKASPFHTSMFITNMASINMTYLYHHLYNFGTTSIFLGLGKIERALKEVGATLGDVVRTRMFVTDIHHYPEFARAHGEFFADIRPVATMVQVAALIDPAHLIEIEVDAVIGGAE